MTKPWNLTPVVAVLCALALFPACAKKKDEKKTEAPAIETPKLTTPGLATDYSTGCIGGAGSSSVEILRFADTQMMRELVDHNGNTCGSPTATTRVYYTYKLGNHRADGVFDLDLEEVVDQYFLTPRSSAVVSSWNRNEKCGINNWTLDEERAVRKSRGNCVSNDLMDRRPIFTVMKMEANRLLVNLDYNANRDQDGVTPARRIVSLGNVAYAKVGTATPGAPQSACPTFAASYACFAGDAEFEGQDLRIVPGVLDGKNVINFELSKAGRQDKRLYQPERGEWSTDFNGRRFTTQDSCAAQVLTNRISVSRIGDTSNREVTERTFRINDRQELVIDTRETVFTNDRPGRESRVTTTCQKR